MSFFDLSSLRDWLKLPTKHLVALALVTGFVLFSPHPWLTEIELDEFRSQFRPWIATVFLLSCALVLVNAIARTWRWGQRKRRVRIQRDKARDRLHRLTPREKEILRGFIEGQTRMRKLQVLDENVVGLARVGLIRQASEIGHVLSGHPFEMPEWVWDYLRQHPELLEPKLRGPPPKERY